MGLKRKAILKRKSATEGSKHKEQKNPKTYNNVNTFPTNRKGLVTMSELNFMLLTMCIDRRYHCQDCSLSRF